jgi:hypothetical protein
MRIDRSSITQEKKYEPPPKFKTLAADFLNGQLVIAYLSVDSGSLRIDNYDPQLIYLDGRQTKK